MNYEELIKFIVKDLVDDEFEVVSKDSNISILVSEADYGRVIGKSGKTINAIRTLIDEASSLHKDKYVRIEVEKKEN